MIDLDLRERCPECGGRIGYDHIQRDFVEWHCLDCGFIMVRHEFSLSACVEFEEESESSYE